MAVVELIRRPTQVDAFKSGNEMAALSASHIGFHVMGYYPITPVDRDRRDPRRDAGRGEHNSR